VARSDIRVDFERSIRLESPRQMPVLPIALDQIAANLANISYRRYSTEAKALAECWSNAIDRFDLDWAGLFIDDLLEFEPLGIEVTDEEEIPRAVKRHLTATDDTRKSLKMPDPLTDGRMPMNLDAQRLLRNRWGQDILICSSIAAPFTAMTIVYGIAPVMMLLYDDPGFLKRSLPFFEELGCIWGKALVAAGADVIWLGDCSASSRFIGADTYSEFALEPARRVAQKIQKSGGKVIYHAAENRTLHLQKMVDVGADILTIAEHVEMSRIKDEIGSRICLMGNLDCIDLIFNGTPDRIRTEIERLKNEVACRGGCIIDTAEGIPLKTPLENLHAMFDAIRKVKD
jgi:uroporphyrinogen decarboxylase